MLERLSRRIFLKGSLVAGAFAFFGGFAGRLKTRARAYLRPPGALDEERFAARCLRCFLCGEICPNKCIKFAGIDGGLVNLATPYIKPREQGCILCMKCTHICPTGALEPIEDDIDEIVDHVRMGRAVVDKTICYSYNNRVCGFCYEACPLPDVALRLEIPARPVVTDKCVGCGLCEKICVQVPQAIRVIPAAEEARAKIYEQYDTPAFGGE